MIWLTQQVPNFSPARIAIMKALTQRIVTGTQDLRSQFDTFGETSESIARTVHRVIV
jgi:hypothetical protein